MSNLEFLKDINAKVYQINDYYYVMIPFIGYDQLKTYIENYNTCVYIKLTENFLNNNDIEYFLKTYNNDYEYMFPLYSNEILISSSNYEYYSLLNNIVELELTENDILMAYQTFAKILQQYSFISDDISMKTQIYINVIEYFANAKTDKIITTLSMILENKSYSYTDTSKLSICGCNSSSNNSISDTETTNCVDIYLQSILLYVKQMFGDIDFYDSFFFNDDQTPNESMIDKLIDLLNGVIDFINNGQSIYSDNKKHNHCLCSEVSTENNNTLINIILNYIKVLNWIKNCEIDENINKIKLYGNQFGEIFPNLYFN